MSLLDRIGKVLKGAASGATSSGSASKPETPAAQPPSNTTTFSTEPAPKSTSPTTGTKGLFGGDEPAAPTSTISTTPTEEKEAPSTKGLFGGGTEDQAAAAAPASTEPKTVPVQDTKGLFGSAGVATPPSSTAQTDGPTSTEPLPDAEAKQDQILPVHPKVLMIVHNPPVPSEGNKRLTEIFKWHDPEKLARGYIEDLKKVSDGYLNYEIVERIDADLFPPKTDGFAYTPDDYVDVVRGKRKAHDPDYLDYHKRIEQFDLQNRFNNGEFDEVWFFSFPYAGEYESIMGGPDGFWCNAPAIKNTDRFKRRFVMMGFNMERGVDCMLENFGHRTESIMTELYKRRGKKQDMWKRFTQYEKQNPGDAQCGWMHYAPNSVKDYDWGNTTPVTSYCDDWYTYPTLPHEGKTMTTKDWGGGDMRAHHLWWFSHLPKTTGETDGISNNWWEYAVDPNKV
jgi:hypothetical protein